MFKYIKLIGLSTFILTLHSAVSAAVLPVLTESTAGVVFESFDVDGNQLKFDFAGKIISEEAQSRDSAAAFDSVSDFSDTRIFFKNGNASYGAGVRSSSRTVVDITVENTGDEAIRPTLNSQIVPAGLGMYVTGCGGGDVRTCSLRDDGDYTWQNVEFTEIGWAENTPLVGSFFDFRVVSGNDVLYSLTGGISLNTGVNGGAATIVQSLSEVENVLTNFRQTSPFGSEQQLSFDWGATDFLVEFKDSIAPGESGTVTYITEVTTFSNALCFAQGRIACPIAYGAFGDPIGRGGAAGTRPPRFLGTSSTGTDIDGIEVGLYEFNRPTLENGTIGFRAVSGPGIAPSVSVSAPSVFGFLIVALAFIYRKRQMI